MIDSILTLLTSKRAMVALLVAIFDLLVLLGLNLDPALAETLATLFTIIGGILIAGISASDHGKALSQPNGIDHKGRGTPTAQPAPTPAATPAATLDTPKVPRSVSPKPPGDGVKPAPGA